MLLRQSDPAIPPRTSARLDSDLPAVHLTIVIAIADIVHDGVCVPALDLTAILVCVADDRGDFVYVVDAVPLDFQIEHRASIPSVNLELRI